MKITLFILAFLIMAGGMAMAEDSELIFDFSKGEKTGPSGNFWEGFTDRVMGGVSEMSANIEKDGKETFLRIRGKVSLKNNGGFIQSRYFLAKDRKTFDASGYSGIAVRVRGVPGSYYLHLRTPANWFPWSFYEATLETGEEWKRVEIPFTAFTGVSTMFALDKKSLLSVAVFAGKKEFEADLSVSRIEFY